MLAWIAVSVELDLQPTDATLEYVNPIDGEVIVEYRPKCTMEDIYAMAADGFCMSAARAKKIWLNRRYRGLAGELGLVVDPGVYRY